MSEATAIGMVSESLQKLLEEEMNLDPLPNVTILAPDERVSVESAIRSVTRNAAWACHSEDEIGSLEPGKLADLVILEDDPRNVAPTAISDIGVSETWMDGRPVFRA